MLIASNNKQHLHIYAILIFTILILSDFIALKYFNFVATPLTNYFALIISCVICIGILLYFIRLKQHGLWFPPYHWRNFRKRPKFYSLFIFPSVMISALWINLTTYPPYLYTKLTGETNSISITTQAGKFKGVRNHISYAFDTEYRHLPVMELSASEFLLYQNKPVELQLKLTTSNLGSIVHEIQEIRIQSEVE